MGAFIWPHLLPLLFWLWTQCQFLLWLYCSLFVTRLLIFEFIFQGQRFPNCNFCATCKTYGSKTRLSIIGQPIDGIWANVAVLGWLRWSNKTEHCFNSVVFTLFREISCLYRLSWYRDGSLFLPQREKNKLYIFLRKKLSCAFFSDSCNDFILYFLP